MKASGKIAARVITKIERQRTSKLIDLSAFRASCEQAEDLQKTTVNPAALAKMHPAHGAYVLAQNQMSVMSELLTQLPELSRFAAIVSEAEDDYMPAGPPMSPLTRSHFFSWAVFDLAFGLDRESIGTCIVAVGRHLGVHPEMLRLMETLNLSRLGLYAWQGCDGDVVRLRELVTGEIIRAMVPAGYRGRARELWLARVLPPPAPTFGPP